MLRSDPLRGWLKPLCDKTSRLEIIVTIETISSLNECQHTRVKSLTCENKICCCEWSLLQMMRLATSTRMWTSPLSIYSLHLSHKNSFNVTDYFPRKTDENYFYPSQTMWWWKEWRHMDRRSNAQYIYSNIARVKTWAFVTWSTISRRTLAISHLVSMSQ